MSRAELEKWQQRYTTGEFTPNDNPSALLAAWLPRLPKGRALDVACGPGRNALFLARRGYTVDAIDISFAALSMARHVALKASLKVNWIQADLDRFVLPVSKYDVVVDNFYLNRALAPAMTSALKPGGVLVFEHQVLPAGDVNGPRRGTACRSPLSPELRLKSGELLKLFHGLEVLHYSEGPVLKDGEPVAIAQLVAQKA